MLDIERDSTHIIIVRLSYLPLLSVRRGHSDSVLPTHRCTAGRVRHISEVYRFVLRGRYTSNRILSNQKLTLFPSIGRQGTIETVIKLC